MDLLDRFAECRSRSVDDIAAAFEDDDQDEVTQALVELIAERTDVTRLPKLPMRVGFTMYGDAGVSEWVIDHRAEGSTVEPGEDAADVDLQSRWEHWEDAVRIVNGDISGLSLFYARRITIGDEPTTDNEPPWLRAVDFAPGSVALEENRVLTRLIDATEAGGRGADDYVASVGMQAIAEARTLNVARALLEAGCAEELKGSYMAVTISDETDVMAVALFGDDGVDLGDRAAADGPNGVVLRYAGRQTLLEASTGARTFQDLLVNGLVKVEGADDARGRFARTLMNFARHHGI